MKKNVLKVHVSWTGNNFCCGWDGDEYGVVVVTDKSLDKLKQEFEQSLKWHIEGCVEDGDTLPEYLVKGEYVIEYELDAAALLRYAEAYTTLAAISRASGINNKQLSHYANGLQEPRPQQRQRILNGLKIIGERISAMR